MKKNIIGPWSFYRTALAIALPVMAQQFIMGMVSLIDNFMVAGLGDISMAAVNVANQLNFICFVLINTMCAAGGIYLAQFCGAKNPEGMKHALRFKIIFSFLVALLYVSFCWIIPGPMIAIMTQGNAAQADILPIGTDYLKLVSITFLFQALSTAIGTSFREIGKPSIPLIISAVATLVNTAGNYCLIYGNFGAPRLEVAGAAVATIIARIFELTCFVIYMYKTKPDFFVRLRDVFFVKIKLVKEILSRSVMMFVSEISWVSSETIITALYNSRGGAEVVAGMAAGWTIANIFFLIFGGIFTASTVIVGGTLGSGKLDEARKKAKWIVSGSTIAGTVVAIFGALLTIIVIPVVFANLTAEARSITTWLVTVILLYMPFWSWLNAQFAISRAGGDTAMGMITDLSVNSLIFVPAAFILTFLTNLGPVEMFAILKISDFVKMFICHKLMKKEKWVRNLVSEHIV
ncbi:MAG: polysaccharide biosynthesis C-terminal domain-containing protein [Treponema sp.]|jgi:putative MATE family efflux protein|nr:polysaccharide biosynthesis C-terminal domain-containing protein [Treponema sp.]